MLNKIKVTFGLLIQYITEVVIGKKIMVGMDAQIYWAEEGELLHYYLSFSKDPVYLQWDDFGVLDDDVFYYLDGLKEAISCTWKPHSDGWIITNGNLVTSDIAE
jgi:hypothetical protein